MSLIGAVAVAQEPKALRSGEFLRPPILTIGGPSTGPLEEQSAPLEQADPGRRQALPQPEGLQTARNLLDNRARLAQASLQFEQQRGPQKLNMTASGRQRFTLNGMAQMAKIAYHQGGGNYTKEQMGQMLASLQPDPSSGPYFAPRMNTPMQLLHPAAQTLNQVA